MSHPILCRYHITTRGNFSDILPPAGSVAAPADVAANLVRLKQASVRLVDFTGGEPLLHPGLPGMLREAKRLGLRTAVTTNGLLYPERAGEIAGLVDFLTFSLDPEPEFDRLAENLRAARSLGESPDLTFTVTPRNTGRIAEVSEFARRNRLILRLNPESSHFGGPVPDRRVLDAVLAAASQPCVVVDRALVRLMKRGGNRTLEPRCRVVTSAVVISPENTILVPCFHQAVMQIPAETHLEGWLSRPENALFRKFEGRFRVCEGCAISGNFVSSFTVGWDAYFFLSRLTNAKTIWDKYVRLGFTQRRKAAEKNKNEPIR
jgi:MoaA/NifB/PqqE/SkfB family radical SAM enzyme